MTEKSGAMQVDAALVRQLAELLDETKLTEIEVQDGERRIKVARKAASVVASAPAAAPAAAPVAVAVAAPAAAPVADTANALKSPMVGTVYLFPEPGAKPFVNVGDTVKEGQTLVIIEAMKVMNPIAATKGGTVTRICVDNGQPVEYDQPLVVID
ncbi:acetyl-CoA carboxylase biotin carboxyl carrier protein [Sphingomonas sp. SUN039]|uniref:acetyl-CoA carboxylase biotin carboxyl carrier protein n=1 Tax=Sphingomonas sp. SUN039 TaxID=2937787 RepID=UPI0021646861|nr:acetyl-CoA carboxylase biotin carboxyl carrier protein [Sphingomonas sp. SUN039]UVO54203.1 acetyl-CoA carboxylase biotin carboxyl carrier protein [Sphingomonas sp. SUN039]